MKPLLAEEVDERDGELDKLCRSNHHPYKTRAKHIELVGADLWNGVTDEKKKKSLKNARPRRGFSRVVTTKLYQPEPENRDLDWWSLTQDVLPSPLTNSPTWIELRAAEIDRAVERLQNEPFRFTTAADLDCAVATAVIDVGIAFTGRWTAPRPLVELTGMEALNCRLQVHFKAAFMRNEVFACMAGWKPYLRDQRVHKDPIAAALQVAFWIRRNVTKGQYQVGRHRSIKRYDLLAATLVIDHAVKTLAIALADKQRRWRAQRPNGTYVTDWTIVQMILDEGHSARDVAKEIGIAGSMVARRFKKAIVAISLGVGPLSSHLGKFAKGVERRAKRTDKPRALRAAEPPAPLPVPWNICKAPVEVWYSYLKEVSPGDRLLIGEALEYFGNVRVPSGCSAGYPVEPARALDTKRRADPEDEVSPIIGKTGALRTEGRYVILRPRATDWRDLARKLRGEAKKKALATEGHIGDLLGDKKWPPRPHWPSKPERRFAVASFNKGLTILRSVGDDYYGPVARRRGELVPRFYDNSPDVVGDVVDRLNDAVSSPDQFPSFPDVGDQDAE